MSKFTSRFSKLKSREDSGFGTATTGRFFNKNGVPNIKKKGLNPLEGYSWYHTMLGMSLPKFIGFLILIYILINLLFASIYYIIGIEHITGIDKSNVLKEFTDVYFFSSQTFTTVGYGRIAPVGFLASLVATIEAFIGLLSFAIATGLFYGRFSRPRAFLKFSKIAIIAPFEGRKALMFRMVPFKNNMLTDAHIILTTAIEVIENGESKNKFFTLKTELSTINSLVLNWTIVHKIDEESPFYEFTEETFKTTKFELFAQVRAFDEVFSNNVVQRTSYSSLGNEIIYGGKFKIMYQPSKDKTTTEIDIQLLNAYDVVKFTD